MPQGSEPPHDASVPGEMEVADTPPMGAADPGGGAAGPGGDGAPALPDTPLGRFVDGLPGGVTVHDAGGQVVMANAAAAALCGCARSSELIGRTLPEILRRFELRDEYDRPFEDHDFPDRRVLAGEDGAEAVMRVLDHTTHEARWRIARARGVRDAQGRVLYVVDVLHDITDRRRAQESHRLLAEVSVMLATAGEPRRALGAVARLAVPRLADSCWIDLAGEAGQPAALADRDPERASSLLSALRGRSHAGADRGAARVLRTGRAALYPDLAAVEPAADSDRRDDLGILRTLGLRSAVMVPLSARDRVLGVLVLGNGPTASRLGPHEMEVGQDIAWRVGQAMDNALLYAKAQREILHREQILSFVSHDVKNPLTAILMNAEQLQQTPEGGDATARVRAHAALIARAAHRVDALIDSLLDAASIEAGRFSVTRRPARLDVIVTDALEVLQPLARAAGIRIEPHLEAVAGRTVPCDRQRLFQVVSNLVGNAVKFTPRGGRVEVRTAWNRDTVSVTVADTGSGIPPGRLATVFDRFAFPRRAPGEGTGLGLHIAKGIIEAHGGALTAANAPGSGAVLTFTLPAD